MNYFSSKKLWGFGILTHGTCSWPKVVLCPEKFVNVLFKMAGSKGKAPKGCRPYKQSTRNQKRQNVSSVNSSDNVWQDACSSSPLVKSTQTYCLEEKEKKGGGGGRVGGRDRG